ncbi:MAG: excinuclease ABC subunit UvrC [Bacteroidota bacterium]|nr:excinuclease ABC subunit UvrC [Bacteroidota bacterium]
MNSKFSDIIKSIPHSPGVYKFYDSKSKIIYVGKAKDLNKRVRSYFYQNVDRNKVRTMVKNIADIKHFVVETETDALLLENNLIKKHRPRYNVLLKDDKTYPYICIKKEPFPRVFSSRRKIKDGSLYFGPYTSIRMVNVLLELFRKIFKLRTCKYNLTEENIAKGKFKVCLEYHIENCKAPCVGLQSMDDYDRQIDEIKHILRGNLRPVFDHLEEQITEKSLNLEYEDARSFKEKYDLLKQYQSRSTVVSRMVGNVDVFNILSDKKYAYINLLKVVDGSIIQVHSTEIKKGMDIPDSEVLTIAITDIIHAKMAGFTNAEEFIVPMSLEYSFDSVKVVVPQIGDKKKLLDLSLKNLKYYRAERRKNRSLSSANRHSSRILSQLQKDLHLNKLPKHIECFDNSNIQGTNPVSACVVFKNSKPSKKDYRKFKIKTVEGPDDFASMYEVVERRYSRLLDENKELPQLIIIDGGKGQLNAAVNALKSINLHSKIAIIGIAKRLEEIFFPGDKIPLYLDKNSESLKLIQHARNEAHRFSIEFHRDRRSSSFTQSELLDIPGVGKKTVQKLLKKYKSIQNIKNLTENELSEDVGRKKAKMVLNGLNSSLNE